MKRKFLLLLCLVTIVALVCTSCDALAAIPGLEGILGGPQGDQGDQGDQNEICEHTFSDKWSTNSTEHWHAATCEHATEKSDVAAHSDADENGKCDVCDYEIGHTHTWAETWSSDENYHWKSATCSHTNEKGELAAHTDSAKDGSCDVCSAHVHVVDIYGKCTVCGEQVSDPDVTNIEVILPVILSNKNNVTGGKIVNNYLGTSVADQSISAYTQTIDYLLGNAASFYKVHFYSLQEGFEFGVPYKNEEEQTQWGWYELLEDNTVSGVYRTEYFGELSDFMINDNPVNDLIGGYYFAVSTLADAYGPENTLKALYDLSQSDAASDYLFKYDNGTYSFSYNYLYVNKDTAVGEGNHVDYYEVAVSFAVSDKGTLTDLAIVCDCYTNSIANELDQDYTYDQNTNTITLKDTAVADTYTFVVTQTEGERTYVAEYTKSDFVPEDFDAFLDWDCTVELGDTVTITLGDFVNLYFGNCTPEYSNVAYIIDSLVINADENIWGFGYGNNVSLYAYAAGTYPVEITLGGKTFSFTIVVEEESGVDIVVGEDEFIVETTDTYGYIDEYTFIASGAGTYTFTIPAGLGWYSAEAYSKWADAEVGFYDNVSGATVTVELAEGEEYVYFIAATTKGEWLISYTYTEGDVEGGGNDNGTATDVVGGTYYGTGVAGSCTLVIDTDASTVTMDGNVYEYTFEDGVVTIYLNGNAMNEYILGVTLGSDGVPTTFVYNGNTYTVAELSDDVPTSIVEGTYLGTDYWGTQALTVIVEGNTVIFLYDHPMAGSSSIVATYEVVNGIVTLYSEDGVKLNPMAGNIVIDEKGVPTSADYNGSSYTLASDGGESDCYHEYADGVCTLCGAACEHEYEENTWYHPEMVSATCVTPGVAVFECIYCDVYYTEEAPIDSEAHAFWGEEEIITPANCLTQTDGLKKVACANEGCTATEDQVIYYDYAHDMDVQKNTEATCTTDGEYYAVCTVCGLVESYESEAYGHYNYYITCGESGECMGCGETFTKEHSGSEPTCTEAGYCYNCWSEYGEALGHSWVDGVCSACEETCDHVEYANGVCTVCGAACEHEYEENTWYHPEFVAATCVTPGVAVFECIYCDVYYTEETLIDSEAHSFYGEEEVITPANCLTQTNGLKKVWCSNEGCTATTEEEIYYYTIHNWDVQKEVYATCTEDGEYYAVCTVCEEVEAYTYYAEGHYNWYLTCGESGECMGCGETFTTPDHSGDPATCTEPAYCYNCWSYYGEALGHNFVDGVCTVCDEAEGEETVGSGTEADPYVLSTLPESITFNSDTINKFYYIFTATETGTITFTWPTADSWADIFELNENGENTDNSASAYETETFLYEITEGTSYRFSLGTWAVEGEVTITITVA